MANFMESVSVVPAPSFTLFWGGWELGTCAILVKHLTPTRLDSPRVSCTVLLGFVCSEVSSPFTPRDVTSVGFCAEKM